ncbi:MAG: thiamine phosphate synthase [Actinomycetota bacterium]
MTTDARLYLVAPVRLTAAPLIDLVDELVSAGVDLIQLREKEMEAGDLLRIGAPLQEACTAAGVPFIVNDRPDVAVTLGADGVHVGQNDLPVDAVRRIFPAGIVGLSTHAPSEVDGSLRADGLDYIAVGPVHETPTKPGRPAAGLDLVRYAARQVALPWFAIGGIERSNLETVMEAGARRVVVVRAITQAPDPVSAAARLKELLLTAPL